MTTAVPSLAMATRLQLRVSPALLAFTEVLALPLGGLEQLVEQELATNPALERIDRPACPGCGLPLVGDDCLACGDRDDRLRPSPPAAEDVAGARPDPPYRPSAAELLAAEVAPLLATGDRWLAAYLVGDLDGRGLLGRDACAVAAELAVDVARVAAVIDAIRAVGPPGVCAVDVRDCLLRQLEPFEARGEAPALLRPIIAGHLEDLGRGRTGAVAAALGASHADVLAARDFLRRHLRPYATLPEPAELPLPAPPDVVIRASAGDPGRFEVEVVESGGVGVRLDPAWPRLAVEARRRPWLVPEPERQRLLADATGARTFLDRLAERSRVLRRVAGHVAERQQAYLRDGPAAHAPLTRAEVAAAVGLHESTVSRAVAGKWVRLPDGRVVPFAELFGSTRSVHDSLLAIVSGEDRPLTDGELAAELHARGHAVARRTVAKYRSQLGIPGRACR
jgi:RNA polymerase sigma-54 factor